MLISFSTTLQNAKETLIYADYIDYDKDQNLIAKGNVKIINENEIITSDLVIYNKAQQKLIKLCIKKGIKLIKLDIDKSGFFNLISVLNKIYLLGSRNLLVEGGKFLTNSIL